MHRLYNVSWLKVSKLFIISLVKVHLSHELCQFVIAESLSSESEGVTPCCNLEIYWSNMCLLCLMVWKAYKITAQDLFSMTWCLISNQNDGRRRKLSALNLFDRQLEARDIYATTSSFASMKKEDCIRGYNHTRMSISHLWIFSFCQGWLIIYMSNSNCHDGIASHHGIQEGGKKRQKQNNGRNV